VSNVHDIAAARKQAAIDGAIASIRECGYTVAFVEARGEAVVVDVFGGESLCYRALIDPHHVRKDADGYHVVGRLLDDL
jgi:hypothetical protein